AADGRANNAIGVIRRGPAQSADNRDAVIRPTLRFDRWFRAGALPRLGRRLAWYGRATDHEKRGPKAPLGRSWEQWRFSRRLRRRL
ncbi:hypothetical protein, partial [Salmonella sp. SAL4439]|uniref:hypothetical protein n=1 Tax=Salmonella sp. SAL4439 TaxID=3159894 RepID=UPI0039795856